MYLKFNDITNDLNFCLNVVLREAKQEHRLTLQILHTMLSTYSNDPKNLAINAPSGEGKSYILIKCGNLFPKEDIIFLSGMTDKALFHRNGKLVIKNEQGEYIPIDEKLKVIEESIENKEEEKFNTKDNNLKQALSSEIRNLEREKKDLLKNSMKLIDLRHKILVFLDTPPSGLLTAIMTLLSHDQYEVEYHFVDTLNGIKTKTNVLRGWPTVIFAQAIDYSHHPRWPEIQRRFLITNPKMSKEKYENAIDLIGNKLGLPDFAYEKEVVSNEDKDKAREIIKGIKEKILSLTEDVETRKNTVIIPFQDIIKKTIPREKASDMTFAIRLFGYLNNISLVNSEKRPKLVMRKEGCLSIMKYPFAVFEDLSEALFLMEYADGVRPYVLEWYYEVFLEAYNEKDGPDSKENSKGDLVTETRKGVTTEDLVKKTFEILNKTFTKKQILDLYVYPLRNQGYIDEVKSNIDGREKICYPIVTTEKNKKLFEIDESNNFLHKRKLIIEKSITFPSKEYIKSKIEHILKYSESNVIFQKITDHEEKDISIEELVDRYYNNGNNFFKLKDNNKI